MLPRAFAGRNSLALALTNAKPDAGYGLGAGTVLSITGRKRPAGERPEVARTSMSAVGASRPMRLAASGASGRSLNTATDPYSSRPSKIDVGLLVGEDLRALVDPARAVALQLPEVGVRMAGVGRLVPVTVGAVVLHDAVGEVF